MKDLTYFRSLHTPIEGAELYTITHLWNVITSLTYTKHLIYIFLAQWCQEMGIITILNKRKQKVKKVNDLFKTT